MRGKTQMDSDNSDENEDKLKRQKIQQTWDHEPHAGIMRGLRARQRLDRVGNVLVPKFAAGDMLYNYNDKTHEGMWRIGVVEFILDTTSADEYLYYNIDPVAQGPTFPKEPCVVVSENNLRTLKWEHGERLMRSLKRPVYQSYLNPYTHWTS